MGDCEHSWAYVYDGKRVRRWHRGRDEDDAWGREWNPRDVIGCAVDFDEAPGSAATAAKNAAAAEARGVDGG